MKSYFISIFIIFACVGAVKAQNALADPSSSIKSQLAELNKSFTYMGKAIHPRAIKELISWVADPLPGPIAVDVEGTFDTNRYFGDYQTRDSGIIHVDLTQRYVEQTGWFSYKYLGRLANGCHVLRTFDNGGGSGVFQSILLVETLIDFEYEDDGTRKQQLILRRRGEFGIGDRYSGEIRVDSKRNTIIVGPDKRNLEKPYRIRIK